MSLVFIRNFAIIAHIDHGKSTLADRMIEICGGLSNREMKQQVLDSMEIERERGITIKAQTVRLEYKHINGNTYIFNLIDTPGHVDFSYEVSRSLSACEGAILVVDASQGVEAQTLANTWLAIEANIEIIPVLNKVDLPSIDINKVKKQIKELIGIGSEEIVAVSAKTGFGVDDLLESLVKKLPAPRGESDSPLKGLLLDSWYDLYRGVMVLIRIYDGKLKKGMNIYLLGSKVSYQVEQVGIFSPKATNINELGPGEVGFFTASIKDISQTRVGDTITESRYASIKPLAGFKPSLPVVFCGIYPVDAGEYNRLKDALSKLKLNDSSFHFEGESSSALGLGFRCGFLGLLHLEIVQERLEREFNIDLVTTAPSVIYHVELTNGVEKKIHNPVDWPESSKISKVSEPWIKTTIFTPDEYLGGILSLCKEKRGEQIELTYLGNRVMVVYDLPLNEVVFDFHDRMKSISKGYASFDYELKSYRPENLIKVSILVNGDHVESLAFVSHKDKSEQRGRAMCEKLKELIPRQLYKIAIQSAIGSKIIARATVSALRKDVTAKCYGGDITRKKKLLEKQKKGKKRMRQVGNIEIPHEAFLAVLRIEK